MAHWSINSIENESVFVSLLYIITYVWFFIASCVKNLIDWWIQNFKGEPGLDGKPGGPGFPGTIGENGNNGLQGLAGLDGPAGKPGLPGLPGMSHFYDQYMIDNVLYYYDPSTFDPLCGAIALVLNTIRSLH